MTELLLKKFVKDYKNISDPEVRKNYGLLGSFFGLITNLLLFIGKIVLGIILHMQSLIADASNNLSDFGNNFIAIFGFKISSKKPDKEHPFGHQRMEYIVSLIIAMVILALGIVLVYQGIIDMIHFIKTMIETGKPVTVEFNQTKFIISAVFLSLSILVKIFQSRLYYSLGKRSQNMELKALSKDSLNDVIATSLVLIGLIISWVTKEHYSFDCFFSVAVGIFVVISSFSILKGAADTLLGQAPDKKLINNIVNFIYSYKDVISMHDLMLHYYGHLIYGVIHIEVDAKKDVIKTHEMIDEIEKQVKEKFHINLTVHIDPILLDDDKTNNYLSKIANILKSYDEKIHFHDFRVEEKENRTILSFDLVVPNEDEKFKKENIENYIKENLKNENVVLAIEYDDFYSDLLEGTDAENSNR